MSVGLARHSGLPLLTLLVLALMAVVTWAISLRQDEAVRRVAHAQAIQTRLSDVRAQLNQAQSAQRLFVISGAAEDLAGYRSARANVGPELAAARTAIADEPAEAAQFGRLETLVARRMAALERGVELRRTEGFAAAAAFVESSHGEPLVADIKSLISGLQAEEARLVERRQARGATLTGALKISRILGAVVLLVLGVLMLADGRRRLAEAEAARDRLSAARDRLLAEQSARAEAEDQARQMQKLQAVGQLTGGIAHDFNNILSIILGSLELARRRLRSDPDRAEAYLLSAGQASERAARLTSQLLAFSRQQPLKPTGLDPNAMAASVAELMRRTTDRSISIEAELDPDAWPVLADAAQLEAALLNLCVNARDAMPEGGRITLRTRNLVNGGGEAPARAALPVGSFVMISVEDEGPGMAPEVAQRAFEPFFTTKAVGQGTGLGLSQVHGFAQQSGGAAEIGAAPGGGAVVSILLPRAASRSQPRTAASLFAGPQAKGETILLVEDDAAVREVTTQLLREFGYEVFPARSGAEALAVAGALQRLDCVVTDVVMPEMNGRALVERLHRMRPDLKVLYISGHAGDALVRRGVVDGGVNLLRKPFTGEELGAQLRATLDVEAAA